MMRKRLIYLLSGLLIIFFVVFWIIIKLNFTVGRQIDSFNGVYVYYNGFVSNLSGRNISKDGYNLGMKYQCVEFVKRYYYEYYNHRMPNSYGNAIDFFDSKIKDGHKNKERGLIQYTNPSQSKPKVGDLLVFGVIPSNKFGHVAIISNVSNNEIEIIQQNAGPLTNSRKTFLLERHKGKWELMNKRILGWLRKED